MESYRIITDVTGRIVDPTDDCARLLRLSPRGLWGRQLPLFFAKDRDVLVGQLEIARRGHHVELRTVLRPRERRPHPVHVRINRLDVASKVSARDPAVRLEWHIRPLAG